MTTRVLSTPPKIALGIHFHGCGTETTPVFLLADWEASWLLLPCLVSPHSQAAQCHQKTPIPASSRLQDRSGSQKRIDIKICHSYHQYSSPQVSLTVWWLRFSFNQPNMKKWGSKLINVINIFTKVFLLRHHP